MSTHQWMSAAESDWWALVETHWMTRPAAAHCYTAQVITQSFPAQVTTTGK